MFNGNFNSGLPPVNMAHFTSDGLFQSQSSLTPHACARAPHAMYHAPAPEAVVVTSIIVTDAHMRTFSQLSFSLRSEACSLVVCCSLGALRRSVTRSK